MKISKRLEIVSNLVSDNSNVIDVGCDHALLDIYLFKNKKNVKIIASDIKDGPLEQAKKNINKYHYDIKVKQGYGLDTIAKDTDTVIITGMGGDTIISILDKGKRSLSNVENLIISPQSEWSKVRKFITSLGFYITFEKIIIDMNKFYLIEKYQKGLKNYTQKELEYGPFFLENKDMEFIKYYEQLLLEHKKILKKIPLYKIRNRYQEYKKIKQIKKIIKRN